MQAEVVPAALDGERLDRLVALVCDCSRSVASELITSGAVTLDGTVVTGRSQRVTSGATVQVDYEPVLAASLPTGDDTIPLEVLHTDEHLIVVNKQPGLVVHPGAGHDGGTLVNAVLARFPEVAAVGPSDRPGIVHRLDRGTSGLLAIARTEEGYEGMVDALSERLVHREYVAVVWGVMADDQGTIDAPIGRSTRRRTRMAISETGKDARTHYEVEQRRVDDPAMTIVACRLETGRTHQIRVHLQAIGHSVVGDDTYGGIRGALDFVSNAIEGGRPALHARRLAFVHPVTGDEVDCAVDPPADMQGLIADFF